MDVNVFSIVNCCACFFYRQWRHVGQALHTDWEPREHWVSLTLNSDKLKLHFRKCAPLLWHRGHELGTLFTSSLNQSPNHLNTSFTFDKEKRFCVNSVVTNAFPGSRSTPTGRPRGCWVRLWSSVVMAQAFTVTWTATAQSNKSSSLPTKSA